MNCVTPGKAHSAAQFGLLERLDEIPPLADHLVDAIARVQMLALAYRSDETWNESAFASKKADENFSQAPYPFRTLRSAAR